MAITARYTLLCDEVRQENNGKFMIIGLYTPGMTVPQLPFAVPVLSFFTFVDSDTPAVNVDFNFRLSQGDTLIAGGAGRMNMVGRGSGVIPIRLGPLVLPTAGAYVFTLDIAGNAPITYEFEVLLQVANLGVVAPTGGGPVH